MAKMAGYAPDFSGLKFLALRWHTTGAQHYSKCFKVGWAPEVGFLKI